jgi:hypothetical protein
LDLATAGWSTNKVSILRNNGDGTFGTKADYDAGPHEFSIFCADLDGDLDLDIAVSHSADSTVSILINQKPSGVEDEGQIEQHPRQFSLSQNYPNPFNPTTKIEFTLAKSGFVTLQIYDVRGRKVRTLVSENLPSGYKSVLWDGKNDDGKDVASGVYFYQLKVGDFSEPKKMLLLK